MPVKPDAPIPGESLIREPGNSPWERPPMIVKPEEAVAFYLEKFQDEERVDDTLFVLDQGMPVDVFVNTMTTGGVMNGIHSLDVATLIKPVLHEYFVGLAAKAGVQPKEFQSEDKKKKEKKRKLEQREKGLIKRYLAENAGVSLQSDPISSTVEEDPLDREEPPVEPTEEVTTGGGLMSRR